MPLNQLPGQDDVIAQLRTIPGVDVYEGQYLTDGAVPAMDNNQLFPPYITTVFGASYLSDGERGIAAEKLNPVRTTVTVYSIAPTDRISREYLDKIRVALTGFVPEDCSPLVVFGGYNFVDADLGNNRYVHSEIYSYTTNMSWT